MSRAARRATARAKRRRNDGSPKQLAGRGRVPFGAVDPYEGVDPDACPSCGKPLADHPDSHACRCADTAARGAS